MTAKADDKLRRSINALERLHAVLVGFAITASVRIALELWLRPAPIGAEPLSPDRPTLELFVAFFVTVIPFFHGAVRHLDMVHLYSDAPPIRFHLLTDYFLLFIQGLVFIAMGESVDTTPQFIATVWVLLLLDSLWGITTLALARASHRPDVRSESAHVLPWIAWNVYTATGLLILLWMRPPHLESWLCAGAIVRTATDYYFHPNAFFDIKPDVNPASTLEAAPVPVEME